MYAQPLSWDVATIQVPLVVYDGREALAEVESFLEIGLCSSYMYKEKRGALAHKAGWYVKLDDLRE